MDAGPIPVIETQLEIISTCPLSGIGLGRWVGGCFLSFLPCSTILLDFRIVADLPSFVSSSADLGGSATLCTGIQHTANQNACLGPLGLGYPERPYGVVWE